MYQFQFMARFDSGLPLEEAEEFLRKSENNDCGVHVINQYSNEADERGIYGQRKWGDFVEFLYNGDDIEKVASFTKAYAGVDLENPRSDPHPHPNLIECHFHCYQKKEEI